MIELHNYKLIIREQALLTIPRWRWEDGRRFLLVGENGSGKSSLLRFLSGMAEVGTGETTHTGKLTFQPQTPYLFAKTVRDNFKLPGLDVAKAREMLAVLQPDDILDAPVSVLSGGQRQKVALVRSILAAEDMLLLDEPFSAMDNASIAKGLAMAVEWQKEKRHRILGIVSHDPLDWNAFDDVLRIRRGGMERVERRPVGPASGAKVGAGEDLAATWENAAGTPWEESYDWETSL